jgi:hypothetical protein
VPVPGVERGTGARRRASRHRASRYRASRYRPSQPAGTRRGLRPGRLNSSPGGRRSSGTVLPVIRDVGTSGEVR